MQARLGEELSSIIWPNGNHPISPSPRGLDPEIAGQVGPISRSQNWGPKTRAVKTVKLHESSF